jgi:hypothetical protein
LKRKSKRFQAASLRAPTFGVIGGVRIHDNIKAGSTKIAWSNFEHRLRWR